MAAIKKIKRIRRSAAQTKIEAETWFYGARFNLNAELDVEGIFSNANADLGYKAGSLGSDTLIKWDAFKFS